jgi:metal-responsive CopG/Arc/MetJ family transcriptional regulator
MTIAKNKEKISSWDRHITVNISIPLKVLAAIDEQVTPGKRSEFIKDILLKSLNL